MKILSWNIRAGGGVRAQAIVEFLLAQCADVIALSEFRGTSASVWIAENLSHHGYKYQRTTVERSNPSQNSLLVASRYPLRKLCLSKAPVLSSRWLAVNVYAVHPVCVMALHVPNRHTGNKYPFLEAVRNVTASWRGLPAVVIGDTNSGRIALDEENPTFNSIEDRWISSMDASGWRDAYRMLQPEGREFTWYSPNGKNGFRLDQMFVHPRLEKKVTHFSHHWVGDSVGRRDAVSDHAALVLSVDH